MTGRRLSLFKRTELICKQRRQAQGLNLQHCRAMSIDVMKFCYYYTLFYNSCNSCFSSETDAETTAETAAETAAEIAAEVAAAPTATAHREN